MAQALADLGIPVDHEDSLEIHARCPKHLERVGKEQRKPHWSINKETGFHNCFSCHYSGTFVDLVLDFTDLGIFEVYKWIRGHGVRLRSSEEIQAVAYNRALTVESDVTVEQAIEITEASLSLFFRPPLWAVEERNLSMESIERYDLLWDIHEQGWIIPVRLPTYELIGWQFKNKRKFLNYPDGMDKGLCVFGLELLEPGQRAIIIESPHDCARMWDAEIDPDEEGVPVSTYGAVITDAQMSAILNVTDRACLALDNPWLDAEAALQTQIVAMGSEKRGKLHRGGWAHRFSEFTIYNYGGPGGGWKDPGEQPDGAIHWGLENAQTPIALGMGRYKDWSKDDGDDVRRKDGSRRQRRGARSAPKVGSRRRGRGVR